MLIATALQAHGLDGLILATMMAGVLLALMGWFRLGTYIQFIPFPVTVGFTAGIAAIIFASQIKPLLGLTSRPGARRPRPQAPRALGGVAHAQPGDLRSLGGYHRPDASAQAPASPLAEDADRRRGAALVAFAADLPVATIAGTFGELPARLPMPRLPAFSLDKAIEVLPVAVAFALLGAIRSLLSAVVADGMSGERHSSNAELVAQGAANVGAALFGGFCVTGTIARTATNVRAGACSPIAGMLHAVFLLAFLMVAAPLVGFIPLAALAAVLALVCWDMVEKPAIVALTRASRGMRPSSTSRWR